MEGHSAAVVSILSLDDNQTLISGSYDQEIIVWNYNTGLPIQKLGAHTNSVMSLCILKDKSKFISCGLDN